MNILVIGCGWLGLPLALELNKRNFNTTGTYKSESTKNALIQKNITAIAFDFNSDTIDTNTFDMIIITVPLSKIDPVTFRAFSEQLSDKNCRLIYTSSTVVYEHHLHYNEKSILVPESERAKKQTEIEHILLNNISRTTILRLGGLIGAGRNPINFLKSENTYEDAEQPVYLLHQTEAINIIIDIIKSDSSFGIVNCFYDPTESKKEFYTRLFSRFNKVLPVLKENKTTALRIISNEKLKKDVGYRFIYKDARSALEAETGGT